MLEPISNMEKRFRMSMFNSKNKKDYNLKSIKGRQDYLSRIYVEIAEKSILSGKELKSLDNINKLFVNKYGVVE